MATRYPAEFRQRAVELARLREKPIKQLATDLGISDQTLHNWMKQADIDAGRRDGLTTEDLRRSYILPPTAFGEKPTTDAADFHLVGVPLVNYLTAPFYLFDAMDTLEKIHRPSLVPITRAAIRIVNSTAGVSAAAMRDSTKQT
jgi:hypothetical protein